MGYPQRHPQALRRFRGAQGPQGETVMGLSQRKGLGLTGQGAGDEGWGAEAENYKPALSLVCEKGGPSPIGIF